MGLSASAIDTGQRISGSFGYGRHRVRRPAFYLLALATVAFFLVALRETMAMAATAWFAGYEFPIHRVHHVVIGGMVTVFVATVAIQLYRPAQRIGAMLAAIIFAAVAFGLTLVTTGLAAASELLVFVVPVAALALLHPAGRRLVPRLDRRDSRLLALAVVGALGLGAIAVAELASHTTLADEHVAFGHYEFLAIAAVTIGLFAITAALRPVGWRALAYGGAVVAILFAGASLAFPGAEQGSSLGPIASVALVLWAVAFVALAEYVDRTRANSREDTANSWVRLRDRLVPW